MISRIWDLFRPSAFATVFAVVSGIIAFYVTSVVEEVRSGPSASYSFKPSQTGDQTMFVLENLSRTHSIKDAHFYLRCADFPKGCFEKFQDNGKDVFAGTVVNAPNFGRGDLGDVESAPPVISFCLSAIASSKTSVRFKANVPVSKLQVLYDPWSTQCGATEPAPLLLLKKNNPHAVLARWYFDLFTWVLGFSAVYFLLMLLKFLFGTRGNDDEETNATEEAVFLFGLRRNGGASDDGAGG